MIPPFAMSLAFFMFVFLMGQLLDITNMIVNYQVSLTVFLLLLVLSLPHFLVYIIPMATMMGILLTFLRMSGDNEIVALKAGGMSMIRLLPPVLLFSFICMLAAFFMGFYGMPRGQSAYEKLAIDVARSNVSAALQENQFNDAFPGIMFYVDEVDHKTRRLRNVFIEDSRQEGISSTVVAPAGYLFEEEDAGVFVLRLYNGMVNNVQIGDRSVHATRFDTYDIRLDLSRDAPDAGGRSKHRREMTFPELTDYIDRAEKEDSRYYEILMEIHMKFSLPFACMALAVLAAPLGMQSLTAKRSAGLGIGLFCFLLYYLLLSIGMVLGETGTIPPVVGTWMPNGVMGAFGIYLWIMTAKDRPVFFIEYLRNIIDRIAESVKKRFGHPGA